MKLANNGKSILRSDIESGSSSFLITTGEGDLFKYAVAGSVSNEFDVFIEQIENNLVVKREVMTVTRVGDTFNIITRKSQACVGNDTATTKTRAQVKYNFTATISQVSMYMSEKDVDEINELVSYIGDVKGGTVKLNSGVDTLEVKKEDDSLAKINVLELEVAGNAKNTAGGVPILNSLGKIDQSMLPPSIESSYVYLEEVISGSIGDRDVVKQGLIGSSITNLETGAKYISSVMISDTHCAISYYITTGQEQKVVVANLTDSRNPVYGTAITLKTGVAVDFQRPGTVEKIEDNKFIVTYLDGADNYAAIVSVTGETMTLGDNKTFETTYGRLSYHQGVVLIDTNKILVTGSTTSQMSAIILTITGTTFTAGAINQNLYSSYSAQYNYAKTKKIDTNKAVIVSHNGHPTDSSNTLNSRVMTITGDSVSVGSVYTIQSGTKRGYFDIYAINTTEVAIIYGTQYGNSSYMKKIQISGTSISLLSSNGNVTTSQPTYMSEHVLFEYDSTLYYAFVYNTGQDIYVGKFAVNGAPSSIIAGTYEIDNLAGVSKDGLVLFNNAGNTLVKNGYEKAGLYNDDKSNVVGFSIGAFSDGEVAKIAIDGIVGGFSGLTTRYLYKLSASTAGGIESGAISTYLVGRAINSSTMKILIYDVNDDSNQY